MRDDRAPGAVKLSRGRNRNAGNPYSLCALLVARIDILSCVCKRSSEEREQMLAWASCLDRWPGELNEVDLLIQKNSKPKLVYYYRSIAMDLLQ